MRPAFANRPLRRAQGPRGKVRIIGGRWKRSPLVVVDAAGLRPTPDRVRETLFNWLSHAFGNDLSGRAVLDLFAGSGALGIEAASRGAGPVVLVDDNVAAVDELRRVCDRLSADQVEIVKGDALRVAEALLARQQRFDVVFLDPPFGQNLLAVTLPAAAALCASSGFVYVEDDRALVLSPALSSLLDLYRTDRAGEVFYHLLQRKII